MTTFRLGWATDTHFDAAPAGAIERLAADMTRAEVQAVVLTGDIALGKTVAATVTRFQECLRVPCYYVLGNHDYYGRSVAEVRDDRAMPSWYLPQCGMVDLAPGVHLIGVDGWGDNRYGNPCDPKLLNDTFHIHELRAAHLRHELGKQLRAFGTAEARKLRGLLKKALVGAKTIVVATHVPPFIEACVYGGRTGDPDRTPFFACKATGDLLKQTAMDNPGVRFLVLSGHTHGGALVNLFPNLQARVGQVLRGHPTPQPPIPLMVT
jgi:predicted phosphohydrolase